MVDISSAEQRAEEPSLMPSLARFRYVNQLRGGVGDVRSASIG
jgi:hypothetical protein